MYEYNINIWWILMFGHIGHFAPFSVLNQGASPAFAKLASQYSPPPDQWPDCFSAFFGEVYTKSMYLRFNNKNENMQYLGSVYYSTTQFSEIYSSCVGEAWQASGHCRSSANLLGCNKSAGNVGVDGGSLWYPEVEGVDTILETFCDLGGWTACESSMSGSQ